MSAMSLVFAVTSMIAFQQPTVTVNGWRIEDLRGRCTASSNFEPNVLVALRYEPARNRVVLGLMSRSWRSIEAERSYPLTIVFVPGRTFSTSSARGFRIESSTEPTYGVNTMWAWRDFLGHFAAGSAMEVRVGSTRLGRFSLQGSREVANTLVRCGERSFREYPGDPFADVDPEFSGVEGSGTSFQQSLMRRYEPVSSASQEIVDRRRRDTGPSATTRWTISGGSDPSGAHQRPLGRERLSQPVRLEGVARRPVVTEPPDDESDDPAETFESVRRRPTPQQY